MGILIGSVCFRCHDNEVLNSFGIPKKFNINGGGRYTRVKLSDMIERKENANLKRLVDEKSQFFTSAAGNMLPVDRSYHFAMSYLCAETTIYVKIKS